MTLDFRKFGVKYGLAGYDVNFQQVHYVLTVHDVYETFLCFLTASIFNHIYEELNRDNEIVRDKFFRVLWMATLIWKLSDYPLPDHSEQLDHFLREAKETKHDGTPKVPKKKTSALGTLKVKIQPKKKKKTN